MTPADAAATQSATSSQSGAESSAPAAATSSTSKSPATAKPATKKSEAPPVESLSTFIAKVRELSAQARPPKQSLPTVESTDPRLREALAVELVDPSPQRKRDVATEYKRLGVFDRAHAYLSQALALDPSDAITLDAIARLWRDAGFASLALPDAHRAVYFAPESPEARNTLGTILQALGHRNLARKEYENALTLNPSAAYALNNLCYVSLLDGDTNQAASLCRRALDAAPGLAAAHNNLALVYATQGDHAAARREFDAAGDPAAALYNTGIVHLAKREYRSAVEAFQAAHTLRPTMNSALVRAKQAASAAAEE